MTTRFQVSNIRDLARLYLAYRWMRPALEQAPGLIRHAFLVQSLTACCTWSIWDSEEAIREFSNAPRHIAAVRLSKRLCTGIWSAYWRLDAVSNTAKRWDSPGLGEWPNLVPHPAEAHRPVEAGRRGDPD